MSNQTLLLFTICILALILLAPYTSATCLTTEQISSLTILLQNSNITGSDKTAFLSIFDTLCNQSYSRNEFDTKLNNITNYVSSKTGNINETIQQEINNYTAWFEEREDIAESIAAMADIVNVSLNVKNIEEMLDRKNQEFVNIFDEMIMDWDEEKKLLVTTEKFDDRIKDLEFNLTALYYQSVQQYGPSEPINWTYIFIAVVILAIIVYVTYGRIKFDKWKDRELRTLPPARHRKMPDDQTEEAINEAVKEAIKKQREGQLEEEREAVRKELEEENKEARLKNRLKKKGTN